MLETILESTRGYATIAGKRLADATLRFYGLSTRSRLRSNGILNHELENKAQEIVDSGLKSAVNSIHLGFFLFEPALLGLAVASNTIDYLIHKKMDKRNENTPYIKSISKTKSTWKNRLSVGMGTYLLVGALAIADYNMRPSKAEKYSEDQVNISVEECTLKLSEHKQNFLLLSELHIFNYSSSEAVKSLFEKYRVNSLLTEGSDPNKHENSGLDGIGLKLLRISRKIMEYGSRYTYSNPRDHAAEMGISIHYLDQTIDGWPKGVTPSQQIALGGVGAILTVTAPSVYFFFTPLHYSDVPSFYFDIFSKLAPKEGIVGERDRLMTAEAASYFTQNSGLNSSMAVGKMHIAGVKEAFKKYGDLDCKPIKLDSVVQ